MLYYSPILSYTYHIYVQELLHICSYAHVLAEIVVAYRGSVSLATTVGALLQLLLVCGCACMAPAESVPASPPSRTARIRRIYDVCVSLAHTRVEFPAALHQECNAAKLAHHAPCRSVCAHGTNADKRKCAVETFGDGAATWHCAASALHA